MISKELLSEVLEEEIKYLETDTRKIHYHIRTDVTNNEIVYFIKGEWIAINIYELAHKCKEWCTAKQGYIFSKRLNKETYIEWQCVINITDELRCEVISNTELEAVFKACEWILKNKDK